MQTLSFDRLEPRLQRWVWDQGWESLRPFQAEAVDAILGTSDDLILSASTASGKTEAVFLPLLTLLAASPRDGLRALYVSPLKALINDQADRLEMLAARVDIPIHRWHGDVSAHRKAKARDGVVLITPESLEALFVLRGPELNELFAALDYVVVDELHVFLGTERGRQLQSQLHRIERRLGRRQRRIALSATLGDPESAARFLRDDRVRVITHVDTGRVVKLQVRGYTPATQDDIVRHLYRTLRDSDNLIFCNRRADVERYAGALRQLETEEHVPATFFPHHGSLSKALREEVEARLRSGQKTTVVCTTTLELGIDFGQVTSVAQIDAPPSVAALFQRLGRSGRRGAPSTARIYATDTDDEPALRPALVQACAMVSLLLSRWIEPADLGAWHLSTLVQQVLSLIAERHGVTAAQAYDALCAGGPFSSIEKPHFALVLRTLGAHKLIEQAAQGLLVLGEAAAKEVEHYGFYAAFASTDEYTVKHHDRTLGTLPVGEPLQTGQALLFAGRSWRVEQVDQPRRTVQVVPAEGGAVPGFLGTGIAVHDRVRQRMRDLYRTDSLPRFLDDAGTAGLEAARHTWQTLDLDRQGLVQYGNDVLLFPWRGDRVVHTLRLQLSQNFPAIARDRAWLRIRGVDVEEVRGVVDRLAAAGPASGLELASWVRNVWSEKWDRYLPQELLWVEYAHKRLDPQGAWETLKAWAEK